MTGNQKNILPLQEVEEAVFFVQLLHSKANRMVGLRVCYPSL